MIKLAQLLNSSSKKIIVKLCVYIRQANKKGDSITNSGVERSNVYYLYCKLFVVHHDLLCVSTKSVIIGHFSHSPLIYYVFYLFIVILGDFFSSLRLYLNMLLKSKCQYEIFCSKSHRLIFFDTTIIPQILLELYLQPSLRYSSSRLSVKIQLYE